MVDKEITYRCTICKTSYPTLEAAMKCEQQGVEKIDYQMFDKIRQCNDRPFSTRRVSKTAKTGYVLGYHIAEHHVYISVGILVSTFRGEYIEKTEGLGGFRQSELVPIQKT